MILYRHRIILSCLPDKGYTDGEILGEQIFVPVDSPWFLSCQAEEA